MSYNFKKIIDLDLVNEVPEGANVLIETDGATKRLPSTAIKPAPIQPDMAQNDPAAPDYVKNRTHYEETSVVNEPLNITWDGNTEGLVSVAPYYKISDVVLTNEQIHLVSCTVIFDGTEQTDSISDIIRLETEDIIISEAAVFVRKDGVELEGVVFPETGIYAFYVNEDTYVNGLKTTEPVEQTKTVVHKLDKKFLPDDIGGGGSTTFYIFDQDDYVYVDPDGDIQADSNDIANAMNKGAVYFDCYYNNGAKSLSSLFVITPGAFAGMWISVAYAITNTLTVKDVRTSDFDGGAS